MIPDRKKTPEEIAALRGDLGIPDEIPAPGAPRQRPSPLPRAQNAAPPASAPAPQPMPPAPVLDPAHPDAPPHAALREPVVHLDLTPAPVSPTTPDPWVSHSLRKQELPLAPAPFATRKTSLPTSRHADGDIAEIRRREAINKLNNAANDPALHLRRITAHPALLIPAYLLAIAPTFAIWQRALFLTPAALLLLASALTLFIFVKKKRSRHHAAILSIIILMTFVFGGLHYAPYFTHGS